MGNDLTKGTTYVDGMMLNAANLNAHVDNAALNATAISARTEKSAGAVTDEFLINDSGTLKKITGTVLYDMFTQTGAVIQSTYGTYSAYGNLTTLIPADDTIPQNTEGTQIISLSFTPRFANSRMVLRFSGGVSLSAVGNFAVAIFRDPGVNAINAAMFRCDTVGAMTSAVIIAIDSPATTSTITYTVRAGPTAASTLHFNGGGARFFGGVFTTILEAQEVRVP
jgi:hypothetical protein